MQKLTKLLVLKNKTETLTIVNTVGLIVLMIFFIYKSCCPSTDIVYVDNMRLFDGFYMTKEMKQFGEKEFNTRKAIVDSLYLKLQSNTISEAEKKQMMPQFVKEKEALEQFNQHFGVEESSKIWSRIHGYVNDFSKEKGYQLIIGSENKQSVFFASEKLDVTNELISYINKKYEGAK